MSRTTNLFVKTALIALLMAASSINLRAKPRELSDAEMDRVHGGSESNTPAKSQPDAAVAAAEPAVPVQSINMGAGAQQNLTSIVNVLSVNSTVQVMLNINVSVDSTVNTVTQGNTGTQTR